jgi:DnaK suppressor protein
MQDGAHVRLETRWPAEEVRTSGRREWAPVHGSGSRARDARSATQACRRCSAAPERDGPLEASDRREPGDIGSEDLCEDEFDQGRREDLLRRELAALERSEARLEEGTYGLSVKSGQPIPDERLEARPTAERTVEVEEERYRRGG